jgi:hypothetical protein
MINKKGINKMITLIIAALVGCAAQEVAETKPTESATTPVVEAVEATPAVTPEPVVVPATEATPVPATVTPVPATTTGASK